MAFNRDTVTYDVLPGEMAALAAAQASQPAAPEVRLISTIAVLAHKLRELIYGTCPLFLVLRIRNFIILVKDICWGLLFVLVLAVADRFQPPPQDPRERKRREKEKKVSLNCLFPCPSCCPLAAFSACLSVSLSDCVTVEFLVSGP